jgi:hypothetical protein
MLEQRVFSHPEDDDPEPPRHLATVRLPNVMQIGPPGPRLIQLFTADERLLYQATLELWALNMLERVPYYPDEEPLPPPGKIFVRSVDSRGVRHYRIEDE